ncbi:ParB N-terminal domain-containing protein [Xanthobacter autotrophicus]|uniref:ParB N-terminal domain-containing protein n=1 Tax=Xanthobacter TaxID=279 RepID=UPI0024ABBA5A|nr:ParB N-terminal domain-containing protein [Xanthobacter autotrophicus]MDI4666733.1 ParB N-terminal domain-containing protein [Xanthobacter autotrophicus]
MVQKVSINLIDVIDRLRAVDPDRAMFIAAGFAEEGQKTPIEVRPNKKAAGRFILVTGGHRLDAAKLLEWEEVDAEILDLSADEARLREINENLYRAELTALDRAVFLAEKKRLYEKLNPAAKHGGDRKSDQVALLGHLIPRFTEEACERLGLSERQLRKYIARAKIVPAVRARITGTPLADNGAELDALLKLSGDEQWRALDLLLSEREDRPRNVAAATAVIRGVRETAPSPDDAAFKALLTAWDRAPKKVRDRFLDHLVAQGDLAERLAAA